jgi:hypothetical protein
VLGAWADPCRPGAFVLTNGPRVLGDHLPPGLLENLQAGLTEVRRLRPSSLPPPRVRPGPPLHLLLQIELALLPLGLLRLAGLSPDDIGVRQRSQPLLQQKPLADLLLLKLALFELLLLQALLKPSTLRGCQGLEGLGIGLLLGLQPEALRLPEPVELRL